jgi:type I restriction enzyme S subunit
VMMFRVSSSNDTTFMMWALNADCTYHQVKQDTVGATSPRVNIETIAEAWLSAPPLNEQQKIGAKISESCLVIDRLIKTIKTHIKIIQKYRQAVITAAVTGKIDVREEVERGAA